jgi:hypothetical protein
MIFEAETVVDPGTMMIHEEDTSVADGAVMSSHWLNVVALVALLVPCCLEPRDCLIPVLQQTLHFLRESLKAVILNVLYNISILVFNCSLHALPCFSLF